MYVRNCWYMAGWGRDFTADGPRAITLLDEPLVIYRQSDGRLAALEDRCCHRLAPLSQGRIEGNDIRCLYHGLKFAPDGACNEVPGHSAIPKAMRVRSYPIVERFSAAFIWMGDPGKVDESLIPPFVGVDDPNWFMAPGRMDYEVNFELIQDNLLDLSHIAWVHRNSFGGGRTDTNRAWAEAELHITQLPRGLRVERWMKDAPTPPHQVEFAGPRCDMLTSFDYLVPGYFLLTSANYRTGAAERAGGARPAEEPIYSSFTAQAVTPLTRKSTCYFFCFGPWARAGGNPDVHRQAFLDLGYRVFEEDRTMLTAQQRIIDADPARRMALFDVDRAPVMYRRLVEKLLQAEAAA
jgi:phenylpropionate dioxygenase-like ring-hydroxylating dioxygenase large terminal subunit